MQSYPAESIILHWWCPECDVKAQQYLTDIVDVGTAICEECGNDMCLRKDVELLPYSKVSGETNVENQA